MKVFQKILLFLILAIGLALLTACTFTPKESSSVSAKGESSLNQEDTERIPPRIAQELHHDLQWILMRRKSSVTLLQDG